MILLSIFWTQLLSSCSVLMPPPPDDTKGVQDWLVVPVFFATNRSYAGKNGSVDYSEDENLSGLLFGVKNVVVPYPVRSPLDVKTEERMQWQRLKVDHDAKKLHPLAPPPDLCFIRNATFTRDEMVGAFDAYRKRSGSKETVVFVHGCCATFDTSMLRAAKLASHMQVPVLLYDWVSPKGFSRYLQNETLAEQTVDGFLSSLGSVQKILGAHNMTLVGHSMGAIILDQALLRRKPHGNAQEPQKFNELIMSNADTDGKTFLNHADEFAANAEKTRIYFSRSDDRLRASAFAHGGFKRLGSPGSLATPLAKVPGIEMIDITDAKTNHELPFWLVSNMHRFGNLGPVKDFTLQKQDTGIFDLKRTTSPLAEPSGLQ
ncbi:MAG TPA: alpha/beta hydrolase [Candidatus Melainabacteria bacterium]|nr:alpha/beta hydrolase [Candidatus Melainabacteria bacterium]HIN66107.1 alpha/beta hydrolase [Candidatus Obscuribacterales bacterium]